MSYNPPDMTPPVLRISSPPSGSTQTISVAQINVAGTAGDNVGVASVAWTNNRGGNGTASGLTDWSIADLSLQPGQNVITVVATDGANHSTQDTVTIVFTAPDTTPPQIAIDFPTINSTFESASSILNLSGAASDDREVSEIRWSSDRGGDGVADGLTTWSVNGVALQAGINVITITAKDSSGNSSQDTLAVTYTPPLAIDFRPLAGSYFGLTGMGSDVQAGFAKVKTTTTGTFTAQLFFQGKIYQVTGAFGADGTFVGMVKRTKQTSLEVRLRLLATRTITGTVSDGVATAVIVADRGAVVPKRMSSAYAGIYTLVFAGDGSDAAAPAGSGYGWARVSKSGQLNLSGKLADGTAVTQGTVLSVEGIWQLYVPIYAPKGSLSGSIVFRDLGTTQLDGGTDWVKPQKTGAPRFAAGFSTTVGVRGSVYHLPATGQAPLVSGARVLQLADGGLSEPLMKSISLAKPARFDVLNPDADLLSLSVRLSDGFVSGAFVHPVSRLTISLSGVILQSEDRLEGFFLGPKSSGSMAGESAQ